MPWREQDQVKKYEMAGTRNIGIAVIVMVSVMWASQDILASESCSESSQCDPGVSCSETTCNCSQSTLSMNVTCSECNTTALLAEPCCCDFMPFCIMQQNADPQLRLRTQVIDDVNGYQQTKADVFLLKNDKYVRVSSVILAVEDCETMGAIQAIQIIQAGEVCVENVTSDTWPTYSDWEMDTAGNTIYPEALATESGSCYGDTIWRCNDGLCAYTATDDPIVNFDSSDHFDWCSTTDWAGCSISSSSNLTESYGAEYGKLNFNEPGLDGGWAPSLYDAQPFIQIRFSDVRTVTGVVTQGMAANFNRRIDAFQIAYIRISDGEEFFIMMEGEQKTFNSSVRFNSQTVSLFEPIVTTVVKLVVTAPASLYLIGGRFSVIEASTSVEKNKALWNNLVSDSPTWPNAANELLSPAVNWTLSQKNGYGPLDIPVLIEERVLDLAEDLRPGENSTITQDNYVLTIERSTTADLCDNDWTVLIKNNHYSIPRQFFCDQQQSNPGGYNRNVTIGVTTFKTLGEIINQVETGSSGSVINDVDVKVVASDIISVVVYTVYTQESVPFRFTLNHTIADINRYTSPTCKFWDVKSKEWSSFGCEEEESSLATGTSCYCNHTTSFSILMSLSKDPPKYDLASDILTYVGLGLSVTSLILSLIIFYVLRRSMTADRVIVHVNLMIAILLADITFLAGIERTDNPPLCKAAAFLLHFFYEAVICWMLVEGVHLYRQIIRVFESERPRTWIYYLVGWGVPAIIVAIAGGVKHDSYGSEISCWLSVKDGTIWAFIGPAIPIMLMNAIILLLVVKTVISASKKQIEVGQIDLIKAGVRSSILLLPLLGIPWLLGPFVHFNYALTYVFDFLNTLQGFFIALFYCFLNSEVRGSIQHTMRKTRDSQNASFTNTSDEKKTRSTAIIRNVRVSPAPPDCDPHIDKN